MRKVTLKTTIDCFRCDHCQYILLGPEMQCTHPKTCNKILTVVTLHDDNNGYIPVPDWCPLDECVTTNEIKRESPTYEDNSSVHR